MSKRETLDRYTVQSENEIDRYAYGLWMSESKTCDGFAAGFWSGLAGFTTECDGFLYAEESPS